MLLYVKVSCPVITDVFRTFLTDVIRCEKTFIEFVYSTKRRKRSNIIIELRTEQNRTKETDGVKKSQNPRGSTYIVPKQRARKTTIILGCVAISDLIHSTFLPVDGLTPDRPTPNTRQQGSIPIS
jgi:hypothetical protein